MAGTRQQLFDQMATQEPDYLYAAVRAWNWSNGTWLLEWVADQPQCTRATAQRIFWDSEPEAFLPIGGPLDAEDMDDEIFRLADLVVRNWHAGRYAPDPPRRWSDRLQARLRGTDHFRADDGTWYAPDQMGFLDHANPVAMMRSYRRAEAQCDPADLVWRLPDDLGEVQRDRRPDWATYDLVEGVPEEFEELLHPDFHAG